MNPFKFFWFTLFILCSILSGPTSSLPDDLKGLKLVHLLYRHGDRTPIKPYPTDPYLNISHWPVGWGQLTSVGKTQHFELGKWLRERYSGFISDTYSEDEILVRSTDVDRTLMSAEANLAGMFPPSGYLQWNPELVWQPIPVHTVPQEEDYLLSSHATCPRFEKLHKGVLETSEFSKKIYKENHKLFEYISTHAGENITDIVKLDYVYDTLLIENIYSLKLPEWTKKVFPAGKFKDLRDLSFTVDTFDDEMKRLKGGPFVNELVEHFDAFVDGTLMPSNRKLFMYSGHDTTVASVLNSMGVFNKIAPPYRSLLLVELLEQQDVGLVVKLSYKNETTSNPYLLTLPGCQQLCPLKKFKELTSELRPQNIKKECGIVEGNVAVEKVTLLAAICSTVLALTVVITILYTIFCTKKERSGDQSVRYQRVDQVEVDMD